MHLLNEMSEGLTLDDLAQALNVDRRTAERLRDVVREHFDLDEWQEERLKRFRIRDSLRRFFTRPDAVEVAALQAEHEARVKEGSPRAEPLGRLLAKVKGALDDRERHRIEPDLDALVRLQRTVLGPGPAATVAPEVLATVQRCIMAGCCLEFDYVADTGAEPRWRRVIPYGLVQGPSAYIVGQMPGRDVPPVFYRLDRMENVRASNLAGCAPEDWDLEGWLQQSFRIWREEDHDIVLRVQPSAAAQARSWRFHSAQTVEEDGNTVVIRFRSGGLREIADHLFTWGGTVKIEAPVALRKVMQERLVLGMAAL